MGATGFTGSFNIGLGVAHATQSVLTKNSGSIPALNVGTTWAVHVGELEIEIDPASSNRPMVLMPDEPTYLRTGYTLTKEQYDRLSKGETTLRVRLTIEYTGVTEKHYCYRQLGTLDMNESTGWVVLETDST